MSTQVEIATAMLTLTLLSELRQMRGEMKAGFKSLKSSEDAIRALSQSVLDGEAQMNADVQALVDKVASLTDVDQSAITLLNDLHTKLDAALANSLNTGDFTAIKQAVADLGSNTDALAAAVTANTPAAPAP